MQAEIDRRKVRRRIRYRTRSKITGTATRPRLAVYRSAKHIYVQAIDDESGRTMAHASSQQAEVRDKVARGSTIEAAKSVGEAIARKLTGAGIETAVLDRGGFGYHGRVKALADAARAGGLKF